jgi:uncharacterized protein involved in outer membrane biogenesis
MPTKKSRTRDHQERAPQDQVRSRFWLLVAAAAGVALVAVVGLLVWARVVLGSDMVRDALAAQVSQAIGQPVSIGTIGTSVLPRLMVNLGDVRIGEPARIQARVLHVGADFRALLSRRVERASLRLEGARIELPLPALAPASTTGAEPAGPARLPVEIVSIDEIIIRDLELVSGGRTLRGELEAVPDDAGIVVRRIALGAAGTTIEGTGRITDLSGPVGELTLTAGSVNTDELLAFLADFSAGAGASAASSAPSSTSPSARAARGPAGGPSPRLVVGLTADRAVSGALALEQLTGRAVVTSDGVTVDPVAFGVFGGRYDGTMALSLAGERPVFTWTATLSDLDMAAATVFAGSPNTISGRLAGRIELQGEGADAATAMRTARGTARVDITNGVVKNLGLLRSVVLATSMREGSAGQAVGGSMDEPFSRLGATLQVAAGSASTGDLTLESDNIRLGAAGAIRLNGSVLNFKGRLQLSEALSQQAGTDLLRYTAEQGRVTLPATITGSAANPSVRVDVGEMAGRALRNRATEEAQKAIKKGLGGLLKRP